MASAEVLRTLIEEARRTGRSMDDDEQRLLGQLDSCYERQRLRRILDSMNEDNRLKEIHNYRTRRLCEMVDSDDVGVTPRPPPNRVGYNYVRRGDVANCRFNVFKKEHVWKVEGMSWLKNTLYQADANFVTSRIIEVGPEGDEEHFQLHYNPFGCKTYYRHFDSDGNEFWQVGSLAVRHYGKGITFRHKFYIRHKRGDFLQWGEMGNECNPHSESGQAYGPDVQGVNFDGHYSTYGIFGLDHETLLESDWIDDDTLTVKLELEIRTDEPYDFNVSCPHVEVPAPDLVASLRGIWNDSKYSDVTFIVDDERVHAHSLILCTRSEVFDRMLNGGMRESIHKEVVVEDCDSHLFKAMLEFLYTDDFGCIEQMFIDRSFVTLDKKVSLLVDLLAVSHRYQVSRLELWCQDQLCHCITSNEVCLILIRAHLYDAKHLEQDCLSFIRAHLAEVVSTAAFGKMSVEWPEIVLKVNIAMAGLYEKDVLATRNAFSAARRARRSRDNTSARDSDSEKECCVDSKVGENACVSSRGEPDSDVAQQHDVRQNTRDLDAQRRRRVIQETLEDRSTWIQHRVLADWSSAAFGDGYIDLEKDVDILVKPGLEDGWAFGLALSSGLCGWFPPTYTLPRH